MDLQTQIKLQFFTKKAACESRFFCGIYRGKRVILGHFFNPFGDGSLQNPITDETTHRG